jgi:hypothetical protein
MANEQTSNDDAEVLVALMAREPIFHRREFGTSRADLEQMTTVDFWEIGASGKIYTRDYVINTLLERYKKPEQHGLTCCDFTLRRLAPTVFLLTYTLKQPSNRLTRRTTIWKQDGSNWQIAFHQGTVIA